MICIYIPSIAKYFRSTPTYTLRRMCAYADVKCETHFRSLTKTGPNAQETPKFMQP